MISGNGLHTPIKGKVKLVKNNLIDLLKYACNIFYLINFTINHLHNI